MTLFLLHLLHEGEKRDTYSICWDDRRLRRESDWLVNLEFMMQVICCDALIGWDESCDETCKRCSIMWWLTRRRMAEMIKQDLSPGFQSQTASCFHSVSEAGCWCLIFATVMSISDHVRRWWSIFRAMFGRSELLKPSYCCHSRMRKLHPLKEGAWAAWWTVGSIAWLCHSRDSRHLLAHSTQSALVSS